MLRPISKILPLLSGALMAASPAWAAAPSGDLPVFSFMGQDTENAATMSELNGKPCKADGAVTTCEAYDVPLAGVKLKYLSLEFYQGKLSRIYGSLYREGMAKMLGAFSEKYGSPIAETRSWQNRAGSKFDNPSFVWRFKGGELALETLGWDINSSSFSFVSDANRPPPPPAVVDF